MTEIRFIGKCLLIDVGGKKILVVGDLHMGYEEALNRTGVFVSRKMYDEMVGEFDGIFNELGDVDEIVLLGDVKHVFGNVLNQEWMDVLRLFDYFTLKLKKGGEIVVVKGNHDAILEPITKKRKNVKLLDYYIEEEFAFVHGDRDFDGLWEKNVKIVVMGHVHPAVKLKEGVKVEKYKCFLEGKIRKNLITKKVIVLPSFIEHNEGSDPRESFIDTPWKIDWGKCLVKVVEDLKVLDFGRLDQLD